MLEKSIWMFVRSVSAMRRVLSTSQLGTVHTCLSTDNLEVPVIDAFDGILKLKKDNALVIWA